MVTMPKNLRLAKAILGGAVLSGLSGCIPAVGAGIWLDHEVSRINESRERAARITAINGQEYCAFSCSEFIDSNNDGLFDSNNPREAINRGKTVFYVGEPCVYGFEQRNCKGKTLKLFAQRNIEEEPKEVVSVVLQKSNSSPFVRGVLTNRDVGNWYAYWTLDGIKAGEHRIQVREKTYSDISKK